MRASKKIGDLLGIEPLIGERFTLRMAGWGTLPAKTARYRILGISARNYELPPYQKHNYKEFSVVQYGTKKNTFSVHFIRGGKIKAPRLYQLYLSGIARLDANFLTELRKLLTEEQKKIVIRGMKNRKKKNLEWLKRINNELEIYEDLGRVPSRRTTRSKSV